MKKEELKKELSMVNEICYKILDIEAEKMNKAIEEGKVYDNSVRSWAISIQAILANIISSK